MRLFEPPRMGASTSLYVSHANKKLNPVAMPDDVTLINLLAEWAPDEKLRHRILVENPERFYGFDPKKRPKAL